MVKIGILDDYQNVAQRLADWSVLNAEVVSFDRHLGGIETAAAALKDFEVLCSMRERMPFPRALFERLPKLKLLSITGPWAQNLDVKAAQDHGVTVVGTRGNVASDVHSTPELAWGLIMSAARQIGRENISMHAGGWQHTFGFMLHKRTIGIVGLGTIGKVIAGYARAFGMNIIAWSPNLTAERAEAAGAKLVSKEELFRQADVVSISLMLSDKTRGIITRGDLELMKPTAVLVNTSRGRLIDEPALVDILQAGRIAGAGLDVFWEEPLPADHPLRALDNVVLTPHLGYVTEETYRLFFTQVVENIKAFYAGKPVRVIDHTGVMGA